jgi:hypothetical protein
LKLAATPADPNEEDPAMTNRTLPTQNTSWGFFGTIGHVANPEDAWAEALLKIASATGCPYQAVRDFLDSAQGRHFADDVAGELATGLGLEDAIDASVDRWMNWTIGRLTERDLGIPRGLPYLTGFVTHYEIMAEAAE